MTMPATLDVRRPADRAIAESLRPAIFLNGARQQNVIAYSIPGGWVLQHYEESPGKMATNAHGNRYATRTVKGAVSVLPAGEVQ